MAESVHDKVKVTINGKEFSVFPGRKILQVLTDHGIPVPHLCSDPRLHNSTAECGLCVVLINNDNRFVKSCQVPVREGMVITTQSDELVKYRKIRLEQILADHNADCVAPCVQTCPAGIDIQSYLRKTANGNFGTALKIIKERNPFPVVCGRVCPHPCEAACRRNLVDSAVNINHVKRFVADLDLDSKHTYIPDRKKSTNRKIAIVGAGPAGLSCAYYSAIEGHDVTVFESQSEAGGMMRYGIPEYRLPKNTLDREIDIIKSLGVKILTGKALGTHIRLEDLSKDFDAVFMGIGSWRANPMRVEGEQARGVWLGINYLREVVKGKNITLGDTVVVVGGGNTAIDCARVALRKGAGKVKLVYRRTRQEMPAEPYEVEEALHEGVEMVFLNSPTAIETDSEGRVKGISCIKMELGEPDKTGRRRPVPIEGSEYSMEADTVIGAIGQSTNTSYLWGDLAVKLNRWGDVEINGKTMTTSINNVFAGGDCVTGPATVVQAVGAGRQASVSICEYLEKGYVRERAMDYSCSRGTLEDLPRYEFEVMPKIERALMPSLPVTARIDNFREVELGLSEEDAVKEAERCLRCGCSERYTCNLREEATVHGIEHKPALVQNEYIPVVDDHQFIIRDHNKCIRCGRCVAICKELEGPDVLGYFMKNGKFYVGTNSGLLLDETDCVSCGQCVNACPCGALSYKRESDKVFKAINDSSKTVVGFVAPAVRSVIVSEFGLELDEVEGFMAGMLKKMGFDKVFDFVFAADLTIVEETSEFLRRIESGGVLPHFTSCCPGWVNHLERRHSELIPHLSTCKSPQQMMGATVKNHLPQFLDESEPDDLFVVSIVPCMAKKYEAAREEFAPGGIRDVDAVLTTEELLEMMRRIKLHAETIEHREFDEPYKNVSGAGVLFGVSGGVAEASLRMAAEKLTGKSLDEHLDFHEVRGLEGIKESVVDLNGRQIRIAVVSGLKNVQPILDRIKKKTDVEYDLIEVMACPGGCIAGAGHPVAEDSRSLSKRKEMLVEIDRKKELRKSHENPDVLKLYESYYGEANSEKAHKLLHTGYRDKTVSDGLCGKRREESTYGTAEIRVCVDKHCFAKGSMNLLNDLKEKIAERKIEQYVSVRPQLCQGHCEDRGPFVTLNGKMLSEEELSKPEDLIRNLMIRLPMQNGDI